MTKFERTASTQGFEYKLDTSLILVELEFDTMRNRCEHVNEKGFPKRIFVQPNKFISQMPKPSTSKSFILIVCDYMHFVQSPAPHALHFRKLLLSLKSDSNMPLPVESLGPHQDVVSLFKHQSLM